MYESNPTRKAAKLTPEEITNIRSLLSECPVPLPFPLVAVTRRYVSRSWSKVDLYGNPGIMHYEVGYQNVPPKIPEYWCDIRLLESFDKQTADMVTTALNFAHQQGIIE